MKKVYIFIVLILSILKADLKEDIAICASKNSDADRLICYDDLEKKLDLKGPKQEVINDKGKWNVTIDRSPIDDSQQVILTLDAETTVQGNFNSYTPTLVLRCSENKTEAYIVWGIYLGVGKTRVLTRLDQDRARTRNWSLSTDNKATFAPGNNVYFIKKLMKHRKLLVQTVPYGANPVMTTFQLDGLNEAIKPLRKACHW